METALILLAVFSVATGQSIEFSRCPNVTVQDNFSVKDYLGKWYEQERFFTIFQIGGDCVTATYTDNGNGVVGVNNRQVYLKSGKTTSIVGTATQIPGTTEAKLSVVFPTAGGFPSPYWVLSTDYQQYALVYSCTQIGPFSIKFSWKLTREKNPPASVMETLQEVARRNGINTALYMKTKQICDN